MAKERQLSFQDISEEWKGMPEFVQEKQKPFRTMKINFRNQEDFQEFCRLLGYDEDLKESVKSQWFPKIERGADSNMRYVDEVPDLHTDQG